MKILIADDHAIVREGLKRIIEEAQDLKLEAEAADGGDVMKLVREHEFDVLVTDLSMPGRSGMELIKLAKAEKPKLRILVLSMHQEAQYAVRAIKSGASGYLTKESAPGQLVQAIRKIAAGGAYVSSEVAEQLALGAMPGGTNAPHESLSDREFEVFRLLVAGKRGAEIADELVLSEKTVSSHKASVLRKLNLVGIAELVRYAIKHDLLPS